MPRELLEASKSSHTRTHTRRDFEKESTSNNWESQARERGKKEKMARIAGANYTDEANLKRTCTLTTVDRDEIGGDSV